MVLQWSKPLAYAAGLGLVAVVGSPIKENFKPVEQREDDYPLSYLPMFSQRRGRTGRVNHLIGLDGAGTTTPIHYSLAGHGGLNQVRRQMNRRVREGRADVVAREVAAKVARSADPAYRFIERVQVVTSRHEYDAWFDGDRTPRSRTIRAEAPVVRARDVSTGTGSTTGNSTSSKHTTIGAPEGESCSRH